VRILYGTLLVKPKGGICAYGPLVTVGVWFGGYDNNVSVVVPLEGVAQDCADRVLLARVETSDVGKVLLPPTRAPPVLLVDGAVEEVDRPRAEDPDVAYGMGRWRGALSGVEDLLVRRPNAVPSDVTYAQFDAGSEIP
jgi:hypothetical protein